MKTNRNRWHNIRLTSEDYEMLKARYRKTKCGSLSEYSRQVLLGKPITVLYRNESMDQILEELACLRKELNAIGNNLNQTVHKLNSVDVPHQQLLSEIYLIIGKNVQPTISSIKEQIAKYWDIWLQKLSAEKA